MEDLVTISYSEYERLLKIEAFLEALEAVGVDNWSGYGDACLNVLRRKPNGNHIHSYL
ncbi:host RecBCD nuclease inhibitor [Enterococcus phage BC611]|uniref:Host recBCD nuclease inhibitor n=1 Tax=Enterococcus phage BC611 TaxID=1173135 RepID=K0IV15_9CAUD|nr:host RecBCD nuclease inhibitor [Enterococcus phage BC611]BAM44931.1 host recBCD nuclease inhibitor [Enterococcus phage BC611]